MESKKPTRARSKGTAGKRPPKRKTPPTHGSRQTPLVLVDAPPDQCFWVNFGPVVKNLRELRDALADMSDEQFAHHVGQGRNDFANWVGNVLGDEECARALRRLRKRQSALKVIEGRLARYA
jgi:hypothetical protein